MYKRSWLWITRGFKNKEFARDGRGVTVLKNKKKTKRNLLCFIYTLCCCMSLVRCSHVSRLSIAAMDAMELSTLFPITSDMLTTEMPELTEMEMTNDDDVDDSAVKPMMLFLLLFNVLILSPNYLYLTWQYYGKRDVHMYKSRRPRVVVHTNIIFTVISGLLLPIHMLIFEIKWTNISPWDFASYLVLSFIMFSAITLRIWHSFYDLQLIHSISLNVWKAIINEQLREQSPSFYFRFKNFLGI